MNYSNGFKQNIKEIAGIAHRKGSLLFDDAYQSAGHIPIDGKEMGIDLLATGTRKYMLAIPVQRFIYKKRTGRAIKTKSYGMVRTSKAIPIF